MKEYVIIGAGSKAQHLASLFDMWGALLQFYEVPRENNESKNGVPVTTTPLWTPVNSPVVFSAIGDTRHKKSLIFDLAEATALDGYPLYFGNLIHPSCSVVKPKSIGKDVVLREFTCVGNDVEIGDHISSGPFTNISHNSIIRCYTTICGLVQISGGVTVEEGVFVGAGAKLKPGIHVGEGALIGIGAVVVEDVPANTVVVGNPARPREGLKELEPWI